MFVTVLISDLETSDDNTMMQVLYYLGRVGSEAEKAVPNLEDLSKTKPEWAFQIDEAIKKIRAAP